MRIEQFSPTSATIVVSRRNLLALLAKLDGSPEDSARVIGKMDVVGGPQVWLKAETDEEHYGSRPYGPGPMHPDTERRMQDAGADYEAEAREG